MSAHDAEAPSVASTSAALPPAARGASGRQLRDALSHRGGEDQSNGRDARAAGHRTRYHHRRFLPDPIEAKEKGETMKLAGSGVRGVFWRPNARGTQEIRTPTGRRRGDWWVRWVCPHGHLHREQIGPKSLAREEAERRRIERPCPARKPKPSSYLL